VIVGTADGGEAAFETWEHLAHEFTAALAPILGRLTPDQPTEPEAQLGAVSVTDKIRKLAALHDAGDPDR